MLIQLLTLEIIFLEYAYQAQQKPFVRLMIDFGSSVKQKE
jgi:hypothetical protein